MLTVPWYQLMNNFMNFNQLMLCAGPFSGKLSLKQQSLPEVALHWNGGCWLLVTDLKLIFWMQCKISYNTSQIIMQCSNALQIIIANTNNNAEEQDHNNHFLFIPWPAGAAGAPAWFWFQSCFLFRLIQCFTSPASPSLSKKDFITHYTLQIEGKKPHLQWLAAQHSIIGVSSWGGPPIRKDVQTSAFLLDSFKSLCAVSLASS